MEQHYDSIDKMMEFGLSMAVAQQMMNTMNSAIGGMSVPTVQVQAPQLPGKTPQYYAVLDDNVSGPFSEEELKSLVAYGKLTGESLMWRNGMSQWSKASTLPEINKLLLLGSMGQGGNSRH